MTHTQERNELVQDIIRWAIAYSKHEHLDHEPFANRVEKAIIAYETALRLEIEGAITCPTVGCDSNGTIAVRVSEDEWEPQECQYCYEVLRPIKESIARIFDAKEIKP